MPRILLLSIFCFFLFGCEEEGGGLIERETDSSPSSSSENSESGGDSSDSGNDGSTTSGVFNIKPYLDASVSTDTIEGTWVAIGKGSEFYSEQLEESSESEEKTKTRNLLQFFIIKETDDRLISSYCDNHFSDGKVEFTDGTISIFGRGSGQLQNNKYAETELKSETIESEYTFKHDYTFKLAKISDLTTDFGSLKMNIGGTETVTTFDCFARDEYEDVGKLTELRLAGETSMFIEHSHSYKGSGDTIGIYTSEAYSPKSYGSSFDNDASYEYSEFESHSVLIPISGGSGSRNMTGSITVSIR